jgi:uncharacterized membrane protein YdbT with pleckstrin-like domain
MVTNEMAEHFLPGESEVLRCRQHPVVLVSPFAGYCVVIAGGIFLQVMPSSWRSHLGSLSKYLPLAVLALIVIGVIGMIIAWARWRATSYQLTTERIIRRVGVLSRMTVAIPLEEVQDIRVLQSFSARLIGAGDIAVESAARRGVETLTLVPHANDVSDQMQAAVEARRENAPGGPGGFSGAGRGR